MRAKVETWTIVLSGAWNYRLFTPEWVGRELLEGRQQQMTVEVPLSPGVGLKYGADGLVLIPSETRLIFGVEEADVALMSRAEALAKKTLTLLPHTPVGGFGINFGFEEEEPGEKLRALFNTSDLDALSVFGAEVRSSAVTRALQVRGVGVNTAFGLEAGRATLNLNFHHDTPSARAASEALGERVETCYRITKDLLNQVYECSLEADDDEPAS
jgi:hypothetical protein